MGFPLSWRWEGQAWHVVFLPTVRTTGTVTSHSRRCNSINSALQTLRVSAIEALQQHLQLELSLAQIGSAVVKLQLAAQVLQVLPFTPWSIPQVWWQLTHGYAAQWILRIRTSQSQTIQRWTSTLKRSYCKLVLVQYLSSYIGRRRCYSTSKVFKLLWYTVIIMYRSRAAT